MCDDGKIDGINGYVDIDIHIYPFIYICRCTYAFIHAQRDSHSTISHPRNASADSVLKECTEVLCLKSERLRHLEGAKPIWMPQFKSSANLSIFYCMFNSSVPFNVMLWPAPRSVQLARQRQSLPFPIQ